MPDQQPTALKLDFATIPNEELYQMCVAGDEPAWQYVYNYIMVIVRETGTIHPDAPEDAAQEVSLRLIARLLKINNPGAFRAYIKTIIRNHFIDRFRQYAPPIEPIENRDDGDGATTDPPSPGPGPDAITHGKILYELFHAHMEKLSQACEQILNVYFNYKLCGQPKNYKEMAEQFGLTVGGIGVRIKRCLEELCAFPSIRDWISDTLKA